MGLYFALHGPEAAGFPPNDGLRTLIYDPRAGYERTEDPYENLGKIMEADTLRHVSEICVTITCAV